MSCTVRRAQIWASALREGEARGANGVVRVKGMSVHIYMYSTEYVSPRRWDDPRWYFVFPPVQKSKAVWLCEATQLQSNAQKIQQFFFPGKSRLKFKLNRKNNRELLGNST